MSADSLATKFIIAFARTVFNSNDEVFDNNLEVAKNFFNKKNENEKILDLETREFLIDSLKDIRKIKIKDNDKTTNIKEVPNILKSLEKISEIIEFLKEKNVKEKTFFNKIQSFFGFKADRGRSGYKLAKDKKRLEQLEKLNKNISDYNELSLKNKTTREENAKNQKTINDIYNSNIKSIMPVLNELFASYEISENENKFKVYVENRLDNIKKESEESKSTISSLLAVLDDVIKQNEAKITASNDLENENKNKLAENKQKHDLELANLDNKKEKVKNLIENLKNEKKALDNAEKEFKKILDKDKTIKLFLDLKDALSFMVLGEGEKVEKVNFRTSNIYSTLSARGIKKIDNSTFLKIVNNDKKLEGELSKENINLKDVKNDMTGQINKKTTELRPVSMDLVSTGFNYIIRNGEEILNTIESLKNGDYHGFFLFPDLTENLRNTLEKIKTTTETLFKKDDFSVFELKTYNVFLIELSNICNNETMKSVKNEEKKFKISNEEKINQSEIDFNLNKQLIEKSYVKPENLNSYGDYEEAKKLKDLLERSGTIADIKDFFSKNFKSRSLNSKFDNFPVNNKKFTFEEILNLKGKSDFAEKEGYFLKIKPKDLKNTKNLNTENNELIESLNETVKMVSNVITNSNEVFEAMDELKNKIESRKISNKINFFEKSGKINQGNFDDLKKRIAKAQEGKEGSDEKGIEEYLKKVNSVFTAKRDLINVELVKILKSSNSIVRINDDGNRKKYNNFMSFLFGEVKEFSENTLKKIDVLIKIEDRKSPKISL